MTTASDSTRIATVPWGRIARVLPAALALAPAAVLLVGAVDRRWMDDDGFINLRVVRNWLHGDGLVFNLDERVEAVTSPLWLAVLAALGALDARLELAAVAAGILLTLVGLLLAQAGAARLCAQAGLAAGDRLRAAPVPVGAAIFAALPAAWDYASSGLETGLGLAWLGASFVAMARSVRATAASRVRVMASALLVGLGPLIRPEFALYAVAPLALLGREAWRGVDGRPWARAVRAAAVCAVAGALPLAYEIFRMGYFAAAAPNTALAKEAFRENLTQGRCYFENFFGTYWLGFPLAAGAFFWVRRLRAGIASGDRGLLSATLWMPVAAAVHAGYVVRIGGDYMHARMFIPVVFAALLPIAMVPVERPSRALGWIAAGAAGATLGAWLPACALFLRIGPENVCDIGDERGWYARQAKSAHPVLLDDFRPHFFYDGTLKVQQRFGEGCPGVPTELGSAGGVGCRRLFLDAEDQAKLAPLHSSWELDDGVDPRIQNVAPFGAIGIAGYMLPPSTHVLDHHGLADPLVARAEIEQRGRPGHEKTLSPAWAVARYARPSADEDASVTAARHALQCGQLASLVRAVTGPITWRGFVDNVEHAFAYGRLRLPRDPFEAEAMFCGTTLAPGSATGGAGGTPFRWRCPVGGSVTGLRGTFQHGERALGSIQALCGPLDGPTFGEKGGEPFEVNCGPRETTIGMHGWSDHLVRAAGLDCVFQGQESRSQPRGEPSGAAFLLLCPGGAAVIGIRGRAGSLVDSIGIECATE